MRVEGHTFVVTGAASGLGAACTARLAARGANVVACDLAFEGAQATGGDADDSILKVGMDVTRERDVSQAIEAGLHRFGVLHGAVSCAGVTHAEKVTHRDGAHDLGSFRRVFEVNVFGVFNVVRLVATAMAENEPDARGERGVFVNTASIAAFDGQRGLCAYSGSKAAVAGMTLPFARDLASLGMRVVAIAPGTMATPMLDSLSDQVKQALAEQVPFPSRLGDPDEFAHLVQHIIENGYLNGEVIRLDGALRMPMG